MASLFSLINGHVRRLIGSSVAALSTEETAKTGSKRGVKSMPKPASEKPDDSINLAGQIAQILSYVRRLVLIVIFVQLAAVFYYLGRDLGLGQDSKNVVILETIEVPKALASRGITANAAASMLQTALRDTAQQSLNTKEVKKVNQQEDLPDIEIPDTGVTLKSLYDLLRNVLPIRGTRVNCRLVCLDGSCGWGKMRLQMRITNFTQGLSQTALIAPDISGGNDVHGQMQQLFTNSALAIYKEIDPFVYASYKFATAQGNKKGNRKGNNKQLDDALKVAGSLIIKNHSDAKYAHNLIGLIYRQQGNFDAAYIEFEAAVKRDPEFGLAYLNLGNTLNQQRKFVAAAHAYKKALDIGVSPHLTPSVQAFFADMLLKKQLQKKGVGLSLIKTPTSAVMAKTSSSGVINMFNHAAIKNYTAALTTAGRVRKNTSDRPLSESAMALIYANLAFAYQRTGNKAEAAQYYRLSGYANPMRARTYLDWGILLSGQQQLKQAHAVLMRAETLYNPRKKKSPKTYGQVLAQLADVERRLKRNKMAFSRATVVLAGPHFIKDELLSLRIVSTTGVAAGKPCAAVQALYNLRRRKAGTKLTLADIGLHSGVHRKCAVAFN